MDYNALNYLSTQTNNYKGYCIKHYGGNVTELIFDSNSP